MILRPKSCNSETGLNHFSLATFQPTAPELKNAKRLSGENFSEPLYAPLYSSM